jgi:hypothetical protein
LAKLDRDFETRFGLWLGEVRDEPRAGLGLSLMLLLAWLLWREVRTAGVARPGCRGPGLPAALVLAGGALASAAYLAKGGALTSARLASTHHATFLLGLIPFLQRGALSSLRGSVWRLLVLLHFACGVAVLAMVPVRPLLPFGKILSMLPARYGQSSLAVRVAQTYAVVTNRYYAFDPLREYVPEGTKDAVIISDKEDLEAPFWLRLGLRVHVAFSREDLEALPGRKGLLLLINQDALRDWFGLDVDGLCKKVKGSVLGRKTLKISNTYAPETWWVVRVGGEGAGTVFR